MHSSAEPVSRRIIASQLMCKRKYAISRSADDFNACIKDPIVSCMQKLYNRQRFYVYICISTRPFHPSDQNLRRFNLVNNQSNVWPLEHLPVLTDSEMETLSMRVEEKIKFILNGVSQLPSAY